VIRFPRRSISSAAVAFAALVTLGACSQQDSGQAAAPAPASSGPPGAAVYHRSCARCHGQALEGTSKADPIDATKLASLGDQRLRLLLQSGKGEMPAFAGLKPEQVDQLIAYLGSMT
jgi:mono/diheme cytochrome c family protein